MLVAIGSAVAAAVLTLPASALGLEPGVHVNPTSPAGIEYAFPLGSTRSELSGQPGNSTSDATSSPALFGVGIRPGPLGAARRAGRGRKRSRSAPSVPAAAVAQARRIEATPTGGSLQGPVLELVAVVLVAGILAGSLGAVLRRRDIAT